MERISVLEFKLSPTPEIESTLTSWLQGLEKCWNLVLGEMLILKLPRPAYAEVGEV